MHVLIIDAQGGGIGRQLVAAIRQTIPEAVITAVGTNSVATPVMATAVGQSSAKRILIPFNHCDNLIAGVSNTSVSALLQEAVSILRQLADVRKEARIFS